MQTDSWRYFRFSELTRLGFWDYYTQFKRTGWFSVYPSVKLKEVLTHRKHFIMIDDNQTYKRCRVQLYGNGVVLRDKTKGSEVKTKKQQLCQPNDFLVAEIDAKFGGYGIVPPELDGAIVSSHYFLFDINPNKLLPEFLGLLVKLKQFTDQVQATGSTNYAAIRPYHVLEYTIPLPPLEVQRALVADYQSDLRESAIKEGEAKQREVEAEIYLTEHLGITPPQTVVRKKGIHFIEYKEIREWGIEKMFYRMTYLSSKWETVTFDSHPILVNALYRGKSPVYSEVSEQYILNQKCVRWNEIEARYAKSVDQDWFAKVDKDMLTREGDILVNSTGEGTIGRSAAVTVSSIGYLFDSHILLARLNTNFLNPLFFSEVINSTYGQMQINDVKSAQSTKQTELGINNLKRIVFPLPPLNDQIRIVESLIKLKNHVKRLYSEAVDTRQQALIEFEQAVFSSSLK